MKVLVTSGGTKIPIDSVRDITNMSKGTFGSKIATELLKQGHEVIFFMAEGSKSPMSRTFHADGGKYTYDNFHNWFVEASKYTEKYHEYKYKTYDQYKNGLQLCLQAEQPDVVILAAAVSDYGVENPVDGKMRSCNDYTIKLKELPKIINYIKQWSPFSKLVGFKLMVGAPGNKLIDAAKKSIADNLCDMIVANDYEDIKAGSHQIDLVFPSGEVIKYSTDKNDPNYLAKMVAEHSIKL
jgi:phosphopantothenoylcysteine synthetase/decarboxylase